MGFKLSIMDVEQIGERVWAAALTPAEIARLGTPAASVGERSVIGVTRPHFEQDRRVLSFDPGAARILNKGAQSTAIIVDLGEAARADAPGPPDDDDGAFRRGDDAFIDECRGTCRGCWPRGSSKSSPISVVNIRATLARDQVGNGPTSPTASLL